MDAAPEVTNLEPGPAIAIRAQLGLEELPSFFGSAFRELVACGADQISGPPFAIYHSFDPQRIDVEAVMPVRAAVPVQGRIHVIDVAGGPAVVVRHTGPYEELGTAYLSLEHLVADHHRARSAAIREVYLTAPTAPPDQRITLVVQPLHSDEHLA